MKKKIFAGVAVLAFAAMVGVNVKMNTQENITSHVSMANVEALAGGEIIVGFVCYDRIDKCCLQFPGEYYEEIWFDMDYA